jgi:hypothetical protein
MQALGVFRMATKDVLIWAASWGIDRDPLGEQLLAKRELADRSLLEFLHSNGLTSRESLGRNLKSWREFELRASDLTEEGFILIKRCHRKWLQSLDRIPIGKETPEKVARRLEIWRSELDVMRRGG